MPACAPLGLFAAFRQERLLFAWTTVALLLAGLLQPAFALTWPDRTICLGQGGEERPAPHHHLAFCVHAPGACAGIGEGKFPAGASAAWEPPAQQVESLAFTVLVTANGQASPQFASRIRAPPPG